MVVVAVAVDEYATVASGTVICFCAPLSVNVRREFFNVIAPGAALGLMTLLNQMYPLAGIDGLLNVQVMLLLVTHLSPGQPRLFRASSCVVVPQRLPLGARAACTRAMTCCVLRG